MWLNTSWAAADEELLRLVNDGYALLQVLEDHYAELLRRSDVDERAEATGAREACGRWTAQVEETLRAIFPTVREVHILRRYLRLPRDTGELLHTFLAEVRRVDGLVQGLDAVRLVELPRYVGASPRDRLYVEDIDSFARVRNVNPSTVTELLKDGRIDLLEDYVQRAFERVLDVPFHRVDFGGETNDLYTANVVVNGARTPTAFVLKGRGCRSRELQIADCGKNGDQLVRLFDSPAELFIVQYVGPVADAVVRDVAGKVAQRRGAGKAAWFSIIDGQDTARVLKAYGTTLTTRPELGG
jgi:hypothetical protein